VPFSSDAEPAHLHIHTIHANPNDRWIVRREDNTRFQYLI
jgi:hypothetical protein